MAFMLYYTTVFVTIETSEPISKRARHSTVTGHMLETLESLEHGLVPPYLKDIHTWKVRTVSNAYEYMI